MKLTKYGLLPLIALTGCASNTKADIMVTSFVAYDAVTNIVGEEMSVRNIVKWGNELHNFEPTPQDVIAINEAKLFVYTSPELDTWVNTLVQNDNSFDMSAHYAIEEHTHEEEESHDHDYDHAYDDHDHEHEHGDIHFFTNPHFYLEILHELSPVIQSIDTENATLYEQNHNEYASLLTASINELNTFLSDLENPQIYFAGHNALDAFADEFGLEIHALTDSYKPDVDFLAPNVVAFIEELKTNDVHHLFVEELVEPRMAQLIQTELAKDNHTIEILELHSYHNITANQAKENVTYAKLFNQNITNIKKALSN